MLLVMIWSLLSCKRQKKPVENVTSQKYKKKRQIIIRIKKGGFRLSSLAKSRVIGLIYINFSPKHSFQKTRFRFPDLFCQS